MYGKYGRKLVKPLRIEKNWNGQKRNQSSTMLEDQGEFTLSILMMKNTKKSLTCEKNWKDLWHQPCLVKNLQKASRKCVAKVGDCIR